jgi:hypothetical protein
MVRGLGGGGRGVMQESTVKGKARHREGAVVCYFPKGISFAVCVTGLSPTFNIPYVD